MTVKKQPIPFGKYYLLDRINIGGMAEVWRAKTFGEQGFEKLVAIKRILPNIAEDDEFISMFIDEAKITVQLTHANIAQVFDLGKIGDSYFIAMEYVAGRDFRAIFDRCRKKGEPAPIPMVCFMVAKMCEGLDYAHRKKDGAGRDLNIVHRDVSPQNCLVSFEGEVKVIDFGIAKAANKATKTQAGILKGKFGYMSPEQVRGLPLDQRSDVFACGVVLYEMLTGERLFVGDSDFSVLEKVRQVDILPPTKYNRRIPEGLEKIVLKSLAKDPEDRYHFASDLADDLQRFLITSDSVFSRKDLMQYMKSTFAEDVEREKMRQAEYAEIKLPAGVAALAGAAPRPSSAAVPVARPSSAAIPVARPSSASNPAVRPPPPAARPPPPTPAPRPPPVFDIDPNDSAPTVGSGFANERTFVGANQAQAAFADDGGTLPGTIPPIAGGNVPRPAPPVFSDATLPPTAPSQRPVVTPVGQRPTMAAPAVRAAPPPRVPAGPPPIDLAPPSLRAHAAPPPADVVAAPSRKKLVALAGIGLGVLVLGGVAAVSLMGGSGTLFVAYEPKDATVVVDGVELCSASPCFDSKLAAGPHQLEIRKEGYQPFSRLVEIPRGDIFRIPEVSLRALETKVSTIIATVPAEAEVRIDGKVVKEQGRTDFYSTEFVAGRPYEVKVSMAGYQTWTQTVTVSADEKLHKEFAQLARAEAQIKLTSSPEGATVIIDQRERGVTPLVATDLDPARPHTVVFRKSCYEDATATIMPGGAADIRKDLVKKPKCP